MFERFLLAVAAGLAAASVAPAASAQTLQIGPSFRCGRAQDALAAVICSSPQTARQDLAFVQAYQALRHQEGEAGQRRLHAEAIAFGNSIAGRCDLLQPGGVPFDPSPYADCVVSAYEAQRRLWLARLSGAALEEATRPLEAHIALQARLRDALGLRETLKADGVYGPVTRAAILAWQRAAQRPETGFLSSADAQALLHPVAARAALPSPAGGSGAPLSPAPGPAVTPAPVLASRNPVLAPSAPMLQAAVPADSGWASPMAPAETGHAADAPAEARLPADEASAPAAASPAPQARILEPEETPSRTQAPDAGPVREAALTAVAPWAALQPLAGWTMLGAAVAVSALLTRRFRTVQDQGRPAPVLASAAGGRPPQAFETRSGQRSTSRMLATADPADDPWRDYERKLQVSRLQGHLALQHRQLAALMATQFASEAIRQQHLGRQRADIAATEAKLRQLWA